MILLRIIAVASLILIVAAIILLIKTRPLKNKYYLAYEADPIIKDDNTYKKYRNIVYKPNKYVSKYIKAYAVSLGKKNTAMISYVDSSSEIAYYIVVYDKYHTPIKVIYIKDTNGINHSSVIALPKKTVDLNIIMESVGNEALNPLPIKPLNSFKLIIFSLIWGLMLACSLIISFYISTEINAIGFKDNYVSNNFGQALLYILIVSLAFAAILFLILKLKNRRPRIKEVNDYAI